MLPFRTRLTTQQKVKEFERIQMKHPNRKAIILERHGTQTPRLDKEKFLVPWDLTAGQLLHVVRLRLPLGRNQAIFLLHDNAPLSPQTVLSTLLNSPEGFLYVNYAMEEAFGHSRFA